MDNFVALIRDTLASKNPVGTWREAKNILLTKGLKSIANEDGFKFEYLVPGTIIGVISSNRHIVYFHKNEEGVDEIGVVNTNNNTPTYKTIVKTNLLNFQLNCPIEGIFVYNYKDELIISWCDGVYVNSNPPRVLNIDNPPFTLNVDKTLVNPNEFYNINLTPNRKQGNLEITYLDSGLLSGYVAYVTFAYVLNDNTNTGYFQSSDIAYLGIYANPVENKGIKLSLTDLDTNYTKLRIGLVIKTEGEEGVAASFIGYQSNIIQYNGTSLEVDITSLNNYETVAAESIIINNTIFEKVNTITKVNNQAHIGNVVTSSKLPFQKYANRLNVVPIEYIDEAETELSNPKGQDASLLPDEVYALYIQLQKLNGEYTEECYHIPGRTPEGTENEALTLTQKTNFDLAWTDTEDSVKQFHIFNNGFAKSMAKPSIGNLNPVPSDESANKMGCWLNTETYPDNDEYNSTVDYEGNVIIGGEDLRNTPIRYHRMPSLESMYNNTLDEAGAPVTNATNWEDAQWGLAGRGHEIDKELNPIDKKRLRKLAIKITNIEDVIPIEIKNQIQGYRILHVKRNSGNSYVVGNWALSRRIVVTDTGEDTEYYNLGGINGFNNLTYRFNWEKTRIISNELFKFRPTLQPTYIKTNYRFQLNEFSQNYVSGFTGNTNFTGATRNTLAIPDIDRFSKCYSPLIYRPGNSIVEETEFSTEGINLDLKPDYLGENVKDTFEAGTSNGFIEDNPYMVRVLLNTTSFIYKKNCYIGFNSDSLNIIGRSNSIVNNTVIKGGDVFNETKCHVYIRSVITLYSAFFSNKAGSAILSSLVDFRGLYSPLNSTELSTDVPEILGDTDPLILQTIDYDFEVLGKEGLSTIHDINTLFTFNVDNPFINKFPYRIYRGLKIANENLTAQALVSYPTSNYYEMPNDKGEIIALRGTDKTLFIQMRYSLFIAFIKDTLKTRDSDTYLGTSDLFERTPEEILGDDKGYVGSVSKFGCIVIKDMYITVNQVNGQIFIIKGNSAIEITNKGNKNWFWNNWDNGLDFYYIENNNEKRRIDNPYISVGHLVGYDKEYDRLLFIKKNYEFRFPELIGESIEDGVVNFNGEFYSMNGVLLEFNDEDNFINKSKTFSFNISSDNWSWICPHDYFPNSIFHTSNGLYSVINKLTGINRTSVYKHNDKLNKGLFYGQKFPSYVDLIFNGNLELSKLLMNVTWITDVINSNGGNENFKTITHIAVYNENQCSGIINLRDNHYKLTRNTEGDWNFNEFRDLVRNPNIPILMDNGDINTNNLNIAKLWFDKSNFISKFITVRLLIDNVDNDTVYIHEVKVNSLISKR